MAIYIYTLDPNPQNLSRVEQGIQSGLLALVSKPICQLQDIVANLER